MAPGTPLHNRNFDSAGTAVSPFGLVPGQPGLSQSIAGGVGEGDDHSADTPNLATDYDRENQFLRLSCDASDNVTFVTQGQLFPDCVPLNLFGRGNASDAAMRAKRTRSTT